MATKTLNVVVLVIPIKEHLFSHGSADRRGVSRCIQCDGRELIGRVISLSESGYGTCIVH